MKKAILYTFTALLAFAFIPNEAHAATAPAKTELPADVKVDLENRLSEIKAMDKSALNMKEKTALRKEVRSIGKTLNQDNGGIYISVGALLIIILILILIF